MFTTNEGKTCDTCIMQELKSYTTACCNGCELVEQQAILIARLLIDAEQVFGGEIW